MSEVVKVPESKHEFEANKNNNDKGVTNEHELLKDADISDDQGMLKYGVDLTVDASKQKSFMGGIIDGKN